MNLIFIRSILILLSVIFFHTSSVQAVEIPLSRLNKGVQISFPSADLLYENINYTPEQLTKMKNKGQIKDLSTLTPTSNGTPEWTGNDTFVSCADDKNQCKTDIELDDKLIPINKDQVVHFDSSVPWIQGTDFSEFQIKATHNNNYIVAFSYNLHNFLLNKALLRKLGYIIPETKWFRTLKVKFKSNLAIKRFIKDISTNAAGRTPRRWIVNINKQNRPGNPKDAQGNFLKEWAPIKDTQYYDDKILLLQDVVIKKANDSVWDLSRGMLNHQFSNLNKRAYKALLIPYRLTDINESINKYIPALGRLRSGNLVLPYKAGLPYENRLVAGLTPNEDDLIWMTRKLAQLKREDFEDIVAQSYYPKPVALILTEKLIEARNWYVKRLLIESNKCVGPITYCRILPTNLDKSLKPHLVNGQLLIAAAEGSPADTKKWWYGYASKFSNGAEESPLNFTSIMSYLKSILSNNIFQHYLGEANKDLVSTDINEEYQQHQIDLLNGQFLDFLNTGKFTKTPFGFWAFPIAHGQLIGSRNIVIGDFMGTNNNIQVARTAGFYVAAGFHLGTEGVPTDIFAAGESTIYYTKTFTHLKPVLDIKKAYKENFSPAAMLLDPKSYLVNLLGGNYSEMLDPVLEVDSELDNVSPRDNNSGLPLKSKLYKAYSKASEPLKKALQPGESLIISDATGPKFNFKITKSIDEQNKMALQFQTELKYLSRIQITRRDADKFNVYITPGTVDVLGLGFNLTSYLNLLSFNWTRQSSDDALIYKAPKTYFFTIDINPGKIIPPKFSGQKPTHDENVARESFKDDINLLKKVFEITNSYDLLEVLLAAQEATTVQHKFTEHSTDANFLLYDRSTLQSTDQMEVTLPGMKSPRGYVRVSTAVRSGPNFQKLLFNVANSVIRNEGDSGITLRDGSNGNPGDTVKGHSRTRLVSFESKTNLNTKHYESLKEPFVQIHYKWKGWSLDNTSSPFSLFRPKNTTALSEVLSEVNNKFQLMDTSPLIDPLLFNSTDEQQLYSIDVYTYIYKRGLEHLARFKNKDSIRNTNIINKYNINSINKKYPQCFKGTKNNKIQYRTIQCENGDWELNAELKTYDTNYYSSLLEYLFDIYSHASKNQFEYESINEMGDDGLSPTAELHWKFKQYQNDYLGYLNGSGDYKRDPKLAAQAGLKLIDLAESQFPTDLFIEMLGGVKNIYTYPIAKGYRVGDESSGIKRADKSYIIGSGFGHIGSKKIRGGLQFIINKTGMNESAFLLQWLLRRL